MDKTLLFNGRSIRNAILQTIAEDHNLSNSLFANSNITILVDIISYMYQSLMTNLKFAAGESMFTDTVLYENITRLAKMIGYYAQGAYPYSLIAKIQQDTGGEIDFPNLSSEFLSTKISYGPYSYNFALVDDAFSATVDSTTRYIRLVLGEWEAASFVSAGEKFEEFEIPVVNNNEKFISQQYVSVFVKNKNNNLPWTYDDSPLFSVMSNITELSNRHRLVSHNHDINDANKWFRYNFYLDENNQYILKFGDGISSAMLDDGDEVVVIYLTSTSTASNITQKDVNAINNAAPGNISKSAIYDKLKNTFFTEINENMEISNFDDIQLLPITKLAGFKPVDDVDSIKVNAKQVFNRQQRVVTKSDYKSFLLERDSTIKDCLVQNNWDFISTFYGYIFNLASQVVVRAEDNLSINDNERGLEFINQVVNYGGFTSVDAADANNVYIWTLNKTMLGINDNWIEQKTGLRFGFADRFTSLMTMFRNVKPITEHILEVKPIWRTYCPYVSTQETISNGYIDLLAMQEFSDVDNVDELLESTKTTINIYADLRYINNIARIKSSVNRLFKEYLYDDIKLGITPSISNLSKDILNITGVNSITTNYFDKETNNSREVPGMQFVSWTAGQLLSQPICFDSLLTFGLPQINPFEYLKCAIGFDEFVSKFIKILPDYSRSR